MTVARITLTLATLLVSIPAMAEPIVGTAVGYGGGLGGTADRRMSTTLFGYLPLPGGWTVGGELAGTAEAYLGGYGCGRSGADVTIASPDDAGPPPSSVPAIGVTCFQPGVAVHALIGVRASPSAATRLRLEAGAGALALFVVPASGGGDTRRDTLASGLIRAAYLARVGAALSGEWWLGVQLEDRAVGLSALRSTRSVGIILEAHSLD